MHQTAPYILAGSTVLCYAAFVTCMAGSHATRQVAAVHSLNTVCAREPCNTCTLATACQSVVGISAMMGPVHVCWSTASVPSHELCSHVQSAVRSLWLPDQGYSRMLHGGVLSWMPSVLH